MGINCVLFQARYWLISLGTASLVSSNYLPGDLHLAGAEAAPGNLLGIRTFIVPVTVACGLLLASRAPLSTRVYGHAHVTSPWFMQRDQSGQTFVVNVGRGLEDT